MDCHLTPTRVACVRYLAGLEMIQRYAFPLEGRSSSANVFCNVAAKAKVISQMSNLQQSYRGVNNWLTSQVLSMNHYLTSAVI